MRQLQIAVVLLAVVVAVLVWKLTAAANRAALATEKYAIIERVQRTHRRFKQALARLL